MLQAYVDDSSVNQAPLYWLAGFIAEADIWSQFSREWAEELVRPPAIGYFKIKEANNGRGAFYGMNFNDRHAKVRSMKSVLNKYLNAGTILPISICMHDNDWKRFCDFQPEKKGRPTSYQILLQNLCANTYDYYLNRGYEGRIDFIFDSQPEQKARVLKNWPYFVETFSPHHRNIIGAAPVFEDDKVAMPIQAADLLAWWMRRAAVNGAEGKPLPEEYWEVDDPSQDAGFIAFVNFGEIPLTLQDFNSYSGKLFYELLPGPIKTVLGG